MVNGAIPACEPVRPSDKVRRFLNHRIAATAAGQRMRLPTARRLAAQLQISPQTVSSIYREFARAGRVETRAGDGTFALGKKLQVDTNVRIGLPIQSSLSVDGTATFYSQVLTAISRQQVSIALHPIDPSVYDQAQTDVFLTEIRQVDGVILMPTSSSCRLSHLCQQAGKPVVTFNMPDESSTTDFVSPDYFSASRQLGRVWAAAGRRRVLYLTSVPLEDSVSSRQRLFGLLAGFSHHFPSELDLTVEVAGGAEADVVPAIVERVFARGKPLPDAIYCFGDVLALGVYQALRQRGVDVPGQISVVGSTGRDMSNSVCPQLTRACQPFDAIANHLVDMLIQRIRQPSQPAAGMLLPMPFTGGSTTTDAENQGLGIDDFKNAPVPPEQP